MGWPLGSLPGYRKGVMASADQVSFFTLSHGGGDDASFAGIALQVAAQALRRGFGNLAKKLGDLLRRAHGGSRLPAGNRTR